MSFETELRTAMRDAAATQAVAPDFEQRVSRRIETHRRRRQVGRGAAAAAAAIVALAAITNGTGARGDDLGIAAPPPDAHIAGWYSLGEAPISWLANLALAVDDDVLVLGGDDQDGAIYSPDSGRWRRIAESPLGGGASIGAWTGEEALVIGGEDRSPRAAAYDPGTDSWRRLSDPPLEQAANARNSLLWTGTEAVVIGEVGDGGHSRSQVAIYEHSTNTWRIGSRSPKSLSSFGDAVWTGTEVIFVGGDAADEDRLTEADEDWSNNLAIAYNPMSDQWRELPWPLSDHRRGMTVVWTGSHLFVGGGHDVFDQADGRRSEAALYDPSTNSWEPVPNAPIPFEGNDRFREVWTGTHVLTLNDGDGRPVAFDPESRTWHVGPRSELGSRRSDTPWIWDGRQALVLTSGLTTHDGSFCCEITRAGEGYRLPRSTSEFTLDSGPGWKVVALQRDGHDCVELRSGSAGRDVSGTCDFSGKRPEWTTGIVAGELFVFGAMPAGLDALDALDMQADNGHHQRIEPIPPTVAGTTVPVFLARFPGATALASITAVSVDGTESSIDPGPPIPPSVSPSSPPPPPR